MDQNMLKGLQDLLDQENPSSEEEEDWLEIDENECSVIEQMKDSQEASMIMGLNIIDDYNQP